jgi:hypothetical protein
VWSKREPPRGLLGRRKLAMKDGGREAVLDYLRRMVISWSRRQGTVGKNTPRGL